MSPHAQDSYGTLFLEHLVDKAVLNVDSSGICTGEITRQLLKGGRILQGVMAKPFRILSRE
jgi:hypothetical protein